MSEWSKLGQKEFKIRHDLMGKPINSVLYKRVIFEYTNKAYIYKPESVKRK